jgi:hypothetical protein
METPAGACLLLLEPGQCENCIEKLRNMEAVLR